MVIGAGGGGGTPFYDGGGGNQTNNGSNGGGGFAGGGGGLNSNGSSFAGASGGGAGYNAGGGSAGSGGGAGGGGFGGGGGSTTAAGGGGGGYKGGNSSFGSSASDGGGSFNAGTNQNNSSGTNNAGGQVIIENLGPAAFTANFSATQPTCANPTQGSLGIDLTGDNDGNTIGLEYAIVSGSSFTGTPSFANITADPFNITSGFGTEGSSGGSTYTVRIRLKYNPGLFIDQTYTLTSLNPGNPTVFGTNTWNVYVWNAGGGTLPNSNAWNLNYAGYYVEPNLNINTESRWSANGAPSSASGYLGCPVGNDNHSYSYKRKGFPASFYKLNVDGHDDGAQLWINGNMAWEHNGCCDAHNNVWSGNLGANDEVEFRVTEGGAGSVGKLSFVICPTGNVLYVKANATGANNGSSWANAYTDLQSALNIPCPGITEIWVAAGTYKPTAGNDRNISFVMKNGVGIYGGFNGTETQLSQRNWRTNVTTLSGDIGAAGNADNSYRVINNSFSSNSPLTNTAVLDGFTIEAANADGNFPLNLGGGMWNDNASPTVRNCFFKNNAAVAGGGIFNANSQPLVTNCLFVGNSGSSNGAAIANGGGTALAQTTNCTFYGNTGPNTINNQSSAAFTNCIIWGNEGGISGGTVSYSNVQGGFSGTGNLNIDPRFVNASGSDFRLQQCSPAIDAGTNANAPATDFEGNTRPFNATGVSNADMGAYEYQSTYDVCTACINVTGGIVYVNASASGSNNGSSWANAFTELQSALSIARTYPSCVSQIWVAKGTYKPTTTGDRTISFSMKNGVAIYGGFNGTETQLSQRNWTD